MKLDGVEREAVGEDGLLVPVELVELLVGEVAEAAGEVAVGL